MIDRPVTIHYEFASLDDVVGYFVKDYGGPQMGTIEDYEYFVDAAKGAVIIKLYVRGALARVEEK